MILLNLVVNCGWSQDHFFRHIILKAEVVFHNVNLRYSMAAYIKSKDQYILNLF